MASNPEQEKLSPAYSRLVGLHNAGHIQLVREPKSFAYPAGIEADAAANAADYAVYGSAHAIERLRRENALTSRAVAQQGDVSKAYVKHALVTQFLADTKRKEAATLPDMVAIEPENALLALEAVGKKSHVVAGLVSRADAQAPHYLVLSARQPGDVAQDYERFADKAYSLQTPQMGNPDGGVMLVMPVSKAVATALQRNHPDMLNLSDTLGVASTMPEEIFAVAARLQRVEALHYHPVAKEKTLAEKPISPPKETLDVRSSEGFLQQLAPHVRALEWRHRVGRAPQLLVHTDGDAAVAPLVERLGSSKSCRDPLVLRASSRAHQFSVAAGAEARLLEHAAWQGLKPSHGFSELDYRAHMGAHPIAYEKKMWMPTGEVAERRTVRQETVRDLRLQAVEEEGKPREYYLYVSADSAQRCRQFVKDIHAGTDKRNEITGDQVIPAIVRLMVTPEMAEHLATQHGIAPEQATYATRDAADEGARIRANAQRVMVKAKHVPPAVKTSSQRDSKHEAAKVIFGPMVRKRLVLTPNMERGKKPSLRKVRIGLQVPSQQATQFRAAMDASGLIDRDHALTWLERVEGTPSVDIYVLQVGAAEAKAWGPMLAAHKPGNTVIPVSENSMREAKALIREQLHDIRLKPAKLPEDAAWDALIDHVDGGTLRAVRLIYPEESFEQEMDDIAQLADGLRRMAGARHAAKLLAETPAVQRRHLSLQKNSPPMDLGKLVGRVIREGLSLEEYASYLETSMQEQREWMTAQRRDAQGNVLVDCLVYQQGTVPTTHFETVTSANLRARDEVLEKARKKSWVLAQVPGLYFPTRPIKIPGVEGVTDTAILRPVSEDFVNQFRRRGARLALPWQEPVTAQHVVEQVEAWWPKTLPKEKPVEEKVTAVNFKRDTARRNLMAGHIDPCRELITMGSVRDAHGRPQPVMLFTVKSRKQWNNIKNMLEEMQRGELLDKHPMAQQLGSYSEAQKQALESIGEAKQRIASLERMRELFKQSQLSFDLKRIGQGETLFSPEAFTEALQQTIDVLEEEKEEAAKPLIGMLQALGDGGARPNPLFAKGAEDAILHFMQQGVVEEASLKDEIVALRKNNNITDRDVANQVSTRARNGVRYFNAASTTPELQNISKEVGEHFKAQREAGSAPSGAPYRFGVFLNLPSLELAALHGTDKDVVEKLTQQVAARGPHSAREAQRRRPAVFDTPEDMIKFASMISPAMGT